MPRALVPLLFLFALARGPHEAEAVKTPFQKLLPEDVDLLGWRRVNFEQWRR